ESPKKVLHPASFKGSIFSLEQKMETLASSGIQLCVLIDFSQDFGKHSGVDFLRLLYKAGVRFLCVGPNFKCGHNMDTNATELMELCVGLGIRSKIVDPVLYKGYPISSSRVRKAISEGDFAEAEKMLGRPYEIRLHAVENEAGACLYSSKDRDLVLPPDGEYRIGIREGAGFRMVEARISMGRLCWPRAVGNPALRVAIFGRVSKEA
ncbi:MAG: hypothetical protein LLF89_05565, partial [Spirochaetaceae bacterium]|nr:hypothetical protein [Spirochaetaceae bacterium]